jgi:hypothetical protein
VDLERYIADLLVERASVAPHGNTRRLEAIDAELRKARASLKGEGVTERAIAAPVESPEAPKPRTRKA